MKLRRIIAAVLAFAMIITASPLENVKFEAAVSTQTISAVDTTYMHWSANMAETTENNIKKLKCNNQGCVRTDMPTIDTLRSDVIEQFNAENNTWNWFAYRISVEEQGTYTLGIKINGCGGSTRTIPICIDNEVYTLTYTSTNQAQTTEVELSAGEHVVVMFSPMPQTPNTSILGNGTYYPYCNFESVLVDSRLTVVKKADRELTDADVVACFYSRVEAGNTIYATSDFISNNDGYKLNGNNAKDPVRSNNIQTWDELATSDGKLKYLAKESTPYVQYIVDVEATGTYYLNVGYQFGGTATEGMDYTTFAVIVNDNVYKVEQKTGSNSTWANQTLKIELTEGRNVIRTTGLLKNSDWYNANAWLNHDYIAIESGAHFVPVNQTKVNGANTFYQNYTANGNSLESAVTGNIRTDIPTIDMLPYAGNLIERWPFASVKVKAEEDGYYDITVNAGINTGAASFQLGMLVDGTSYSMPFKKISTAGIDTSVYLPAGEHVITFLIPMPEHVSDTRANNGTYYPWMNYNTITFGTGLTVQSAPTIEEIKAHLGTTITVGDEALLVNKYDESVAGTGDKVRHNKYANPNRNILKDKKITLENILDLGFDKLPYIAYEVEIETAGKYEVGALIKTNPDTLSTQMGLIIDESRVESIEIDKIGVEQFVSTEVALSAGKHTIMLTCAMPKDNASVTDWSQLTTLYPWFDVFELYIGSGAIIGDIHAQDADVIVEMEDTTYVNGEKGTPYIAPYIGASSGKVVGTTICTSEKFEEVLKSDGNKYLQIDWGQMSYAEFATTGTAGEHELSFKVLASATPDKNVDGKEPVVYIYVNGSVYTKQLADWNTFEVVTIQADLVEGINVFKCFAVADEASDDTGIFFDTISFDTTKLEAVSVSDVTASKTKVSFVAADKVFTHKYPVSGDSTKLANPEAGDMQYRKYYIDALNINQLTYVPYAAVKVNADHAGYYEVAITAGAKTEDAAADRIAMLVDGKAYTLRYVKSSDTTLKTMVYLEKGTHMLIFTSPMPQSYDEVKDVVYPTGENPDFTELKNLYPWFDMKTLILDAGLSIAEKPGYGDVDFSEVIDSIDTIIDAGDESYVVFDNYEDKGATLEGANSNELKANRLSLETLLLHGFDKAPYASFDVTATEDGTYHIYALVKTDASLTSDQIAFIVDRMKVLNNVRVEKKGDNQIIHAEVTLTKGTHNIIFTAPMPLDDAEAQAIKNPNEDSWAQMNGKYHWMNYIRFGIDKKLILVSAHKASIVNGIEAEDSDYVKYEGDFEAQIYPGATGDHAVKGNSSLVDASQVVMNAPYIDWNKMPCIEFAVDAANAGEQQISIGLIATNAEENFTATTPKLFVYANGQWKTAEISSWNTFGEVTFTFDLEKGVNVIKVIAASTEVVKGTRVIYDYIEFDETALTAVKVSEFEKETIYNAGDENNILPNDYTDKGDTLGDAYCSHMRWSKYYIEGLNVSQILRIPHAAMKVKADKDGYYNIEMTASTDANAKSSQIAVLVDGKAYPLSFTVSSNVFISGSVYLTAGEHTLIFTSPMPLDKETAEANENEDTLFYPWFDMNTITLGNGLIITEKIRVEEVMLADKLGTVGDIIDAGNEDIVLPNRYTEVDNTLQNAGRDSLKSNRVSAETLLSQGFDKAPYASLNVTASKADTYYFYAVVKSAKGMTAPQIMVIVDRMRVIPVSIQKTDDEQLIQVAIELEAGTHNLMFTSPMPLTNAQAQDIPAGDTDNWAGMNAAYIWLNYNCFAVDADLVVEDGINDKTTTGIEAEDSTYVKFEGDYAEQKYPGASSAQAMVGSAVASKDVDTTAKYFDWNKLACMEFAVEVQSAGTYEIDLGMITTNAANGLSGDLDADTPILLVYANGKWSNVGIPNWNDAKVSLSLELAKGVNIIKCIAAYTEELKGIRIGYDYIELGEGLTAVRTEDFVSGKDYNAGNETIILPNHYTDKGDTLGGAYCSDMRWSKYYIEGLNVSQILRIPHAAMKVKADKDGYYNIEMTASTDVNAKSSQIAVLVDGKAYPLSFTVSSNVLISGSVYLTAGEHTLIFTSPMPLDKETAEANENEDTLFYPWFDMNTITLDNGININEIITIEEVMLADKLDKVGDIIEAVDKDIVLSNRFEAKDGILQNADRNYIKNNRVAIDSILEHGFDKTPYASFDVIAEKKGEYSFYAIVESEKKNCEGQIFVILDSMNVTTVDIQDEAGKQLIEVTLELEKGKHTIIFGTPMPEKAEDAAKIEANETIGWTDLNNAYRWMNYIYFAVDSRLVVKTGITDQTTTGVEAEDDDYVKFTGDYTEQQYTGASSAQAMVGSATALKDVDTKSNYFDWNKLACMEFAVEAQIADTYKIDLGMITTNAANGSSGKLDAKIPVLLVYANGKWSNVEIPNWNAAKVTLSLELVKGVNIIKCIAAYTEDVEDLRVIYDYIELGNGLTAVKTTEFETGTLYDGKSNSIVVNQYTKNDTVIGSAATSDLRYSKYYIEGLEMSQMHRIPYVAMEVTVTEERYYDITINAAPNTAGTSKQIALIVDGKAYPMSFIANNETTLSASIKLTAGKHLLMFTSPMPIDADSVVNINDTNVSSYYPWFNFNKFYLDKGMTLTKDMDVHTSTVGVEETSKVSKNWSSYKVESGMELLSAITDDMKSNRISMETLLEKGLERVPYVSVIVKAEKDGWYDISATVNRKANTASSIALIVDSKDVYAITLCSVDAKNQETGRYIYLTKGTHTVTFTAAMPETNAEAEAITNPSEDGWSAMNTAYPWFNFHTVSVDGRLTIVEGKENPLKDATVLFIGDNITHGCEQGSWADKIGTWNGMDYINAGVKGATVSTTRAKIIRHQLMTHANSNFEYLIMHGGINDVMSEEPIGELSDSWDVADFDCNTFIGALEAEFYYAYEHYDGAKMGYIITYATPNSNYGGFTQNPKNYYDAAKAVCMKWNIPYIDLFEGKVVVNGQELSYSYDILKVDTNAKNLLNGKATEIHLSDEGYRVISPYIEAWMKTLSVNPNPLQEENRWKYVNVGDINKVLFNGFTAKDNTLVDRVNTGMVEDEANIALLPFAKDMLGDWAFASIKVTAKEAGNYRLFVEVSAKFATTLGMLVDGEARTLNYTKTDGFYQYIEQTVTLSEGTHYITITAAMPEEISSIVGNAWDIYPWTNIASIVVDPELKVESKPTIAEVTALLGTIEDKGDISVDGGAEVEILAKDFKDKGDTLGDANYGDIRWDALTLDKFTYDNLKRMPYFAVKVLAEEDGYYDILIRAEVNPATISNQLGLLVDSTKLVILPFRKEGNARMRARAYSANGADTLISTSVYLTKGTHTLTFTTPMPATVDEFDAYVIEYNANLAEDEKPLTRGNGVTHPWMNVNSITFSKGITVEKAPTKDEIETPFYNRIEAENGDYVIYNNYEPTPEKAGNASEGFLIGGQQRWIFEQTFEELSAWLDAKHNSYVEYAVMAPADGEYNIRLGFVAGAKDKEVAKPYIAVIVNGTAYKVQFTKDWNELEKAELTVSLKEGLNIIRCTSYTIEQEAYEGRGWINHDFLDIDKRLTAVKRSSVKVEAEDSAYFNKFEVQDAEDYEKASGKVLGKTDRKYVAGLKLTLDQINLENLKQIPYASFTVEAPTNGYYAMSLDMGTDGRMPKSTIGLLVDGNMQVVKYNRTGKSTAEGRADALVYLTKGEHVLTFTIPMPADATVETNYSYCWANFDALTLYDGLTLAATQKVPTTEADYTRIEVEEHAMYNLNKNTGTAAGGAYYKVLQSIAEMLKDGINDKKTPYTQFTIHASEAGTYTIYVGVSYGMTEGSTKDETDAQFVVDVNGVCESKMLHATKKAVWSIVPITMNLKQGKNVVRLTHMSSDCQYVGTTWIDYDYIEMPEQTADKLTFEKTSITLEAEEGVFVGYNVESGDIYSQGQYLGSGDYGYVDENDVTFENLNPADLDEMPHVTYNFEVEKAGTYTLSIGFAAGLYHFLTNEMGEGRTGGFAVVVNGASKQLVEYELKTANSQLTRTITVDLVEGENEISITTTLADYIIGHTPRDDEKYRLIWMDQDYLVLSEGLSRGKEPEKYGLEDSDYNHAQITLKTSSDENEGDLDEDKKPVGNTNSSGDTVIPIIVGALVVVIVGVYVISISLIKKKKKANHTETTGK